MNDFLGFFQVGVLLFQKSLVDLRVVRFNDELVAERDLSFHESLTGLLVAQVEIKGGDHNIFGMIEVGVQ